MIGGFGLVGGVAVAEPAGAPDRRRSATGLATPAGAFAVDIDSTNPAGTQVALAAKTYAIRFAGIAGGGA